MINKNNLPALDDPELRRINNKKIIKTIEEIGNFAKWFKWKTILELFMTMGFIIFFIVGILGYVQYKTNGSAFDNVFGEEIELSLQNYNCSINNQTAIFRDVSKANDFKDLYPEGECIFKRKL